MSRVLSLAAMMLATAPGAALAPQASASDAAGSFAPPTGPMLLTRAAIDAAVDAARRQIASPSPGDLAFLARIRAAAAGSATARWPATLFLPGPFSKRTDRTFTPPGGDEGAVEITFTRSGCCGTMQQAERKVTTRVGGEDQPAIERWTLGPESS